MSTNGFEESSRSAIGRVGGDEMARQLGVRMAASSFIISAPAYGLGTLRGGIDGERGGTGFCYAIMANADAVHIVQPRDATNEDSGDDLEYYANDKEVDDEYWAGKDACLRARIRSINSCRYVVRQHANDVAQLSRRLTKGGS